MALDTCQAGDSGYGCVVSSLWILLGWVLAAIIGGWLLLRWAAVPRPAGSAALALALLVVLVVAIVLLTVDYTFAGLQRRFEALHPGPAPWVALAGIGAAATALAAVGLLNGRARRVLVITAAAVLALGVTLTVANLALG